MQSPPNPESKPEQPDAPDSVPRDSVTRGFLFSDLRAYTDYVETHGAARAASLLDRYRTLVRDAIKRFGGAEIKTEGDSFYVVFNSVSNAVRCGLVITGNALLDAAEHPDELIKVGIGVHAGETIETAEGYVGSPVNIAARICSQAGPNEVLVSETVRALTRTLLPVHFESRGRRQLKGIAEPVALFAVIETAPGGAPWAAPRKARRPLSRRALLAGVPLAALAGLAVILAVIFRAAGPSSGASPSPTTALGVAGLPPGSWRVGLELPISKQMAFRGIPMRNAIQLAIDDANRGGGIHGTQLSMTIFDDTADTIVLQAKRGAANAKVMADDPTILAMVGPAQSGVAHSVIPITNEAGLLQCSPSNTDPFLTKQPDGRNLRSAHPNQINYVRLAPRDDIQAPALASYAFNDLKARVALVVDDGKDGQEIANGFQQAFEADGGEVLRTSFFTGIDVKTVLRPLSQASNKPGLVFFGGFTETGAPALRKAMIAAGHGDVPFLSWDGIFDGSGADAGSYINAVGATDAVGSFMSHASLPLPTATFAETYRRTFNVEPDEYSAAAYACTQVIIESLRAVATTGQTPARLREAVRAYAIVNRFDTVIGDVRFDANGDLIHQFVTFYRVDPSAVGGKGDWVIAKQQDFGPAPP
jgi:branched-chain amino acid transport system substrate-binding protein